jgi:hypothetical protein
MPTNQLLWITASSNERFDSSSASRFGATSNGLSSNCKNSSRLLIDDLFCFVRFFSWPRYLLTRSTSFPTMCYLAFVGVLVFSRSLMIILSIFDFNNLNTSLLVKAAKSSNFSVNLPSKNLISYFSPFSKQRKTAYVRKVVSMVTLMERENKFGKIPYEISNQIRELKTRNNELIFYFPHMK